MLSVSNRFWSKVDKSGPAHPLLNTACWIWAAGKDDDGYGCFYHEGRIVKAHRMAFLLAYGHFPEPMGCHRCDEPSCVNPEHIFEGTALDNNRDRMAKGRSTAGDHCRSCGRGYTPENTKIVTYAGGLKSRCCIACLRRRKSAYEERIRKSSAARSLVGCPAHG